MEFELFPFEGTLDQVGQHLVRQFVFRRMERRDQIHQPQLAAGLHAALATLAMLPHTYTQTNKEVVLYVPLAADVRAKEVHFKCTSQQLSLSVRGAELQGEFFLAVKPDESTWELEDEPAGRRLRVGLCKARPNHKWDCCFLHEVDVSHHTGH